MKILNFQINDWSNRNIIILSSIFLSVATFLIIIAVNYIFTDQEWMQPPSQATIIVEVSVGIFIATVVYVISRKEQNRLEGLIKITNKQQSELKIVIDEQKSAREKRRETAYIGIFSNLSFTATHLHTLLENWDKQMELPTETRDHNLGQYIGAANRNYEAYWFLVSIHGEYIDETDLESFSFFHKAITERQQSLLNNLTNKKLVEETYNYVGGIQKSIYDKVKNIQEKVNDPRLKDIFINSSS